MLICQCSLSACRHLLQERPDLSEMKSSLMVNNARMKAELSLLEDTILQMLSASQGNILDDENLINTLAVSKVSLLVSVPALTISNAMPVSIGWQATPWLPQAAYTGYY